MFKFAARIISLESKMFQSGADPNYVIGKSLFVHAVLAMCDGEPSLATELALLRKQECRANPLTLAQTLDSLSRSCTQPRKAVAYQGKVMYCHDYNNGRCRRGAAPNAATFTRKTRIRSTALATPSTRIGIGRRRSVVSQGVFFLFFLWTLI